jgi:two-component system sensor histidine kinase YesM
MGIAVALFLANKIADRITQPLSQLSKVIGNIDMGEISSRAPISGSDEITILSKSFNHLMDNQEALHEKELLSQKAVLESQFKLYQAQIIPHFLCNSLEPSSP